MIFRQLRDQLISSIPLTSELIPSVKLKPFWNRLPCNYEIQKREYGNCYNRIGLICSDFSKVRCIDIDDKHDPESRISDDYLRILRERHPKIYDKLYIERTKSQGHHLIFKANITDQTKEFRKNYTRAKTIDGNNMIDIYFDTHFVVIAPTESYEPIHGSIFQLNYLEDNEVMLLLNVVIELDRFLDHSDNYQEILSNQDENKYHSQGNREDLSIIEKYNSSNKVLDLLAQYGWKIVKEQNRQIYFKRPGKSNGVSAIFDSYSRMFSVFTTSSVFKADKTYMPWHLYVHFRANGDSRRAYHLLKKEISGTKSTRIFTTGYISFKDHFFKELRSKEECLIISNKQLYQDYLDFATEIECDEFYPRSTFTSLIRNDAEYYGYKAEKVRRGQEYCTEFRKDSAK